MGVKQTEFTNTTIHINCKQRATNTYRFKLDY